MHFPLWTDTEKVGQTTKGSEGSEGSERAGVSQTVSASGLGRHLTLPSAQEVGTLGPDYA